jgi:hypothetical protein
METVRIRYPGWEKAGSGIKHPGSATLHLRENWVPIAIGLIYGIRSLKFNWTPCVQLYIAYDSPHPKFRLFLSNLSLIYEGVIDQLK